MAYFSRHSSFVIRHSSFASRFTLPTPRDPRAQRLHRLTARLVRNPGGELIAAQDMTDPEVVLEIEILHAQAEALARAKKIVLEVNTAIPDYTGFHDIVLPTVPPVRRCSVASLAYAGMMRFNWSWVAPRWFRMISPRTWR